MLRILKYLKNSKGTVLAIVILLMVQAYCDLSLPRYMSDIVDVGIQQGGIELPEKDASLDSQRALLELRNKYQAEGVDLGKLQTDYLLRKGAGMLGLSLVMVLAAILVGLLAARTAAKVGMELRGKVYQKVISFSGGELDKFSTASLITRTTNDIQQIQQVSVMLLRMVAYAPIVGLGGIIKVAETRTGMSWIIVVAVGSIVLLVASLMSLAMPRFKKMQALVDKLNLISREIVTGIPVIRAFSREKHEEARFDAASSDLMKTQLFTNRVMTFMQPAMMLIMNAVTVLIIWVGAQGIDMGSLQVGDMMAFISYTMQIVMSFLMLTMVSVMIPRAGVSAARIDEVLATELSVTDSEKVRDSELSAPRGTLAFENVSFRYPDAEENVLNNISFTAESGQTTAIIGSTGSGKSTLLNLIPRFYDVTEGKITVDGIDIREISQHKLREMLGLVPQKGVLFSGTIESNIKYGGETTDEMMQKAAEIAQSTQFIEEKTEGYASPISQGGTNVSGGQKQRLSIARAIAKKPAIFLFDDSFSALDYKTDGALRHAIAQQLTNTTVIIVAQRISTILHAQRIVVLDEGAVAGIGTHEELMESCEAYREIAKSQLSEKELEGGAGR
ncbi:MAG: ABC transporter ATP-binding protein [Angelakisella sp.]